MARQPTFFRLIRRSGLCLAGLFFVILGSVFAASGTMSLLLELRYRNAGDHVRGTVISKSIERASGSNSSTKYQVVYRFVTAQGAAVEGSDQVDVDLWEELKNGDPFEVVYLPDAPQSNRSVATTEMPLALGFAGIGTFAFLVGAAVLIIGVRAASRNARLWREGILVEAAVLAKSVSGTEHCLRYRFHDLSGREFTHYDDTITAEEYALWEVGKVGMIRYDPQDPRRSVWVGTSAAA